MKNLPNLGRARFFGLGSVCRNSERSTRLRGRALPVLEGHPMEPQTQELKNWLAELAGHDATDTRGILSGIAEIIRVISAQLEPGPRTAPLPVEKGGAS